MIHGHGTAIGQERIVDTNFGDTADVEYKYWSNTSKTINETFRTSFGNFVNVPEIKAIKSKLSQTDLVSGFDWFQFVGTASPDKSVKLDYYFRPVRKLWAEYKDGDLYMKIFPLGDQWEAYTSDDPMGLSNNRVYWAPSPWTWSFQPGREVNTLGGSTLDFQRSKWNWDQQWFAEDSNRTYLTYLRGMTLQYNYEDTITFDVTAASPMTPWEAYDDVTSVPMAMRLKYVPNEKWTFGSTYTAKFGIDKRMLKGFNNVGSVDINYKITPEIDVFGQGALSYTEIKHPTNVIQKNTGYAYMIGLKGEHDIRGGHNGEWDIKVTNMSQEFQPGLSDYKDTRIDRDWGRHIRFEPTSWEDNNIRIGDSIDMDRFVVGANAKLNLYNDMLEFYFKLEKCSSS